MLAVSDVRHRTNEKWLRYEAILYWSPVAIRFQRCTHVLGCEDHGVIQPIDIGYRYRIFVRRQTDVEKEPDLHLENCFTFSQAELRLLPLKKTAQSRSWFKILAYLPVSYRDNTVVASLLSQSIFFWNGMPESIASLLSAAKNPEFCQFAVLPSIRQEGVSRSLPHHLTLLIGWLR